MIPRGAREWTELTRTHPTTPRATENRTYAPNDLRGRRELAESTCKGHGNRPNAHERPPRLGVREWTERTLRRQGRTGMCRTHENEPNHPQGTRDWTKRTRTNLTTLRANWNGTNSRYGEREWTKRTRNNPSPGMDGTHPTPPMSHGNGTSEPERTRSPLVRSSVNRTHRTIPRAHGNVPNVPNKPHRTHPNEPDYPPERTRNKGPTANVPNANERNPTIYRAHRNGTKAHEQTLQPTKRT